MAFQFHNMMSCTGFDNAFMGGCSMAWLGLVIAVFVIMIARKWLFEEAMQQEFGFIVGLAATVLAYFLMVGFTGSYKWATLVGILAGLAGGYFAPMFTGGGNSNSGF